MGTRTRGDPGRARAGRPGAKSRERRAQNRVRAVEANLPGLQLESGRGNMKSIELEKKEREVAIASIKRYFAEELPEPIGDLPAGLLLNFFLEEVGPLIYNRAVTDA